MNGKRSQHTNREGDQEIIITVSTMCYRTCNVFWVLSLFIIIVAQRLLGADHCPSVSSFYVSFIREQHAGTGTIRTLHTYPTVDFIVLQIHAVRLFASGTA